MPDFARFDRRRYPTVSVEDGYRDWSTTYEDTVQDEMDLALLRRVESVVWNDRDVLDLGCGTGRTGAWLREASVGRLIGVDLTPEMLDRARARGVFDELHLGDVRQSGQPHAAFDVVTSCLVDEHLEDLAPLYAEAARCLRPGGSFVLVGIHPFFVMHTGMSTHFDHPEKGPVALPTHVHLPGAHVRAAQASGLELVEHHERLIDDAWISAKPKWEAHRDWPISAGWVWRRAQSGPAPDTDLSVDRDR